MDERHYFNLVAQHLGLKQKLVDASTSWSYSSEWLRDEQFDIPFHPAQGANQVRLGAAAREAGVGVVLGGEGGDEWMNGSELFLADAIARRHLVTAARLAREPGLYGACGWVGLGKAAFRGLVPFPVQAVIDRVRGQAKHGHLAFVDSAHRTGMSPLSEHFRRVLYWDDRDYQRNDWFVIRQINKLEVSWRDWHEAAANRIERRPPFYDLRVVELMASTPHYVKRFRGRRKDILREAMLPVLPRELADRRDWGLFDELVFRGLRETERHRADAALVEVSNLVGVDPQKSPWNASRFWITNTRGLGRHIERSTQAYSCSVCVLRG